MPKSFCECLLARFTSSLKRRPTFTSHEDFVDLFLIQKPAKVDIRPKKGGFTEDNVLSVARHLGQFLGVHGRSVVGFIPWCSSPKAPVQASWSREAKRLPFSVRAPMNTTHLNQLLRKFIQCLVRHQRVSRHVEDELSNTCSRRSGADHDGRMQVYSAIRGRHFV